MVLVAIIHYFDTMLSLLDGIYLVRVHRLTPRTLSISFAIYILPYLARVHASVSFGYGQERSSRSYDSSTTMKDLVRRIYLLSIATNTCKTYCLTLKSMGKASEVYLLAIAQSFLFTCVRSGLPATYY